VCVTVNYKAQISDSAVLTVILRITGYLDSVHSPVF
jgi:hypothetical protein